MLASTRLLFDKKMKIYEHPSIYLEKNTKKIKVIINKRKTTWIFPDR